MVEQRQQPPCLADSLYGALSARRAAVALSRFPPVHQFVCRRPYPIHARPAAADAPRHCVPQQSALPRVCRARRATGGSRPELRVACWEPRRRSGQRDPLRHRSRHRHRYRRRCRPDESLTAAFEAAPGERRKFLLQRRVRSPKVLHAQAGFRGWAHHLVAKFAKRSIVGVHPRGLPLTCGLSFPK